MAAEETAVADNEATFDYPITIEDAGPSAKRISIEIPESRIREKLSEQFGELTEVAALPGFRAGKVPAKLLERRFGKDVRDQVQSTLIRESYQQALQKHELKVLGEPEFADAEKVALPESGPLNYSFVVEVSPEITLPDLTGLTVKRPVITITDEHVDQAMQNLREQQGTLVPADTRGVKEKDFVTASVELKLGDELIGNQKDAQIVVRPGNIAGIEIKDLPAQLNGAKVNETRVLKVTAPDNHPAEKIRGKAVELHLAISDIKELELATIDQDFLESLGLASVEELRKELREQMEIRIKADVQNVLFNQLKNHLVRSVELTLPLKVTKSQEARVVQRRASDLVRRGVPVEAISANLEKLREGASSQAQAELRLFFILNKAAETHDISVDEAEVNGEIAMIAANSGERPQTLKAELNKQGQLQELYLSIRERKTLEKLLESVKIEDVEVKHEDQAASVSPDAKDPVAESDQT